MIKEIATYDYVTVRGNGSYFFVSEIINDVATIVGMKLTQYSDSIMFYSMMVNIDKLSCVTEYFINTNGPLAILRENMMKGINDVYIEGLSA